jgi:hypothetical protein
MEKLAFVKITRVISCHLDAQVGKGSVLTLMLCHQRVLSWFESVVCLTQAGMGVVQPQKEAKTGAKKKKKGKQHTHSGKSTHGS